MKRSTALIALLAFLAAVVGTLAGQRLVDHRAEPVNQLHVLLYEELDLNPAQNARLHALERDYVRRKALLEQQMRRSNARLARAIATEHGYGPRVEAAVDQSHHRMGALQKMTLEHVFAMRSVLTAEQARRYDDVVTKLLVDPGR